MVLRFLGESVTDSNGLAVLPDGYTGTGAGEIDVVAKTEIDDRILQSETYEVLDCLFRDTGLNDGSQNNNWIIGSAVSVERTSSGTILKIVSSTVTSGLITCNSNLTGDIEVVLQVQSLDSPQYLRIGFRDTSNARSYVQGTFTENTYVKLQRKNNTFYAFVSSDGVNWTSESLTTLLADASDTLRFQIGIYNSSNVEQAVKYHEVDIYPI